MANITITNSMISEVIDELRKENDANPPDTYQHYCVLFPAGEIGWYEKVGCG
jgi:hypothetical protein